MEKDATGSDDVGEYELVLLLSDAYPYGDNTTTFNMTVIVDIPERPFHVYAPKNEGPFFLEDITQDEI